MKSDQEIFEVLKSIKGLTWFLIIGIINLIILIILVYVVTFTDLSAIELRGIIALHGVITFISFACWVGGQ